MKSPRMFACITAAALLSACQPDATGPLALTSRSSNVVVTGSGTWTTAAAVPVYTSGTAGAGVKGYFYSLGGDDQVGVRRGIVQRYDPVSNSWDTMASMPDSLKYHVAVGLGDNLYVASGSTNSTYCNTHLWRYRPSINAWAVRAPSPICHNFTAAAALGGYIYLIAGSDAENAGLNQVDRYDPTTNSWTTVEPLPVRINSHEAQVVNGKLYVVGGFNLVTAENNTFAYEYDPIADSWTAKDSWSDVYFSGMNHATSAVIDGIIYLMYQAGPEGQTLAYDPAEDKWSLVASHPGAGGWFRASGVVNGQLHVAGGNDAGTAHHVFTPAFAGNVQPVVASLPSAVLLEGESYEAAGFFIDPDRAPWNATVDYGLGSGLVPLPLTGQNFALDQVYATAGKYDIRVRVEDNEGLHGARRTEVRVRTLRWGVHIKIFEDVMALENGGLSALDAERLYYWLRRARGRFRENDPAGFDVRMDAFKAEVDELVGEAKVTAMAGTALKTFADRLKAAFDD